MTRTIGVTGPNGFIARWVISRLEREEGVRVVTAPRELWGDHAGLARFTQGCDAIVHLAGVNRGDDVTVERRNAEMAELLVEACEATAATPHLVFSSTTKRDDDTPYGRGKRAAEETLRRWAAEAGAAQTTLVIPNIYGAGCRPFYNSVVATFCHQLTHGKTPSVNVDAELDLLWVGDLTERIAEVVLGPAPAMPVTQPLAGGARLRVTALLELLEGYRESYFERDVVPDIATPLAKTLYGTFLSHLEPDDHRHRPPVHADERGKLCEVIKTDAAGQVFFSTTKPGVTRGNHYHTRKVEWFCVVRGEATIRLRSIHGGEVREYRVSGESPEFISIPVLHTHSIENTGSEELVTLFWCNELFEADDPDTFYEPVLPAVEAVATAA